MTREDVAAFRASHAGRPGYAGSSVGGVIALVVLLAVFGIMAFSFLVPLIGMVGQLASSGNPASLVVLLVPITMLLGVGAVVVLVVRRNLGSGANAKWERWIRLDRFAEANGMVFSPLDANPQYPGAIFGMGGGRAAVDHMRAKSGRFLDLGNYRYVTSSGKSSTTHNWGFMALELDRSLPHMVLDSKSNNGLFGGTNLPATFARDQVLSLEGDFDQYFTLYCPKEYERDALYVFTPDLMALCIDEASPFDLEVVDRWLFVYSATPFDMQQPWVYERLLRIAFTVGAKTLTQTDRYADERMPDARTANVVAPQGRRLRRGIPVLAVVVAILVAGFWLLPMLIGMMSALLAVGS